MAFIDGFFDQHVANPRFVVGVPFNLPGVWPPEVEPLYDACVRIYGPTNAFDQAKLFAGNVYCRVAIARSDIWSTTRTPPFPRSSAPRFYVLHRHRQGGLHREIMGI